MTFGQMPLETLNAFGKEYAKKITSTKKSIKNELIGFLYLEM